MQMLHEGTYKVTYPPYITKNIIFDYLLIFYEVLPDIE